MPKPMSRPALDSFFPVGFRAPYACLRLFCILTMASPLVAQEVCSVSNEKSETVLPWIARDVGEVRVVADRDSAWVFVNMRDGQMEMARVPSFPIRAAPVQVPDGDRLGWVGRQGSTLIIQHRAAHGFSLVGPAGEHRGYVGAEVRRPHAYSVPYLAEALLADGGILYASLSPEARANTESIRVFVRYDAAGRLLDTLWTSRLSTPRLEVRHPVETVRVTMPQPFRADPFVLPGVGGDELILVVEQVLGEKEAKVVLRYVGRGGVVRRQREVTVPAEPVTGTMVGRLVDHLAERLEERARWSTVGPGKVRAAIREALYSPKYAPAIVDVKIGSDGVVWLRRYGAPGTRQRWLLVSDGAGVYEEANLPGAHGVEAVDGNGYWTVSDQDGRMVAIRYGLINAGACPR